MAKHIAKRCKAKATVDLSKAISKEDTNAKATACKMITSIAKDIMGKETQKIKCALQKSIRRGQKTKPPTPTGNGTRRSGRRGATSKQGLSTNSSSALPPPKPSQQPQRGHTRAQRERERAPLVHKRLLEEGVSAW